MKQHVNAVAQNAMNSQLFDVGGGLAAFLSVLKADLDACRRQVDVLTNQLSAQRTEFETYRRDTDAKLSKLQRHKKILSREVIALRIEANEGGMRKMVAEANRAENLKFKSPDPGGEDSEGASPD